MNKDTPHIIITTSHVLAPVFASDARAQDLTWQPMPAEDVEKQVQKYKTLWAEKEDLILKSLTDILELHFLENYICAYIISGQKGGMSDPIIISANTKEERFVDVLTHELIHRLLSYHAEEIDTRKITTTLFGHFPSMKTTAHIMVNAVEEYLYREVLHDEEMLRWNINYMQPYPALKASWDYVQEKGYRELLEVYKSHYHHQ